MFNIGLSAIRSLENAELFGRVAGLTRSLRFAQNVGQRLVICSLKRCSLISLFAITVSLDLKHRNRKLFCVVCSHHPAPTLQ
jgi:hypothetical protein